MLWQFFEFVKMLLIGNTFDFKIDEAKKAQILAELESSPANDEAGEGDEEGDDDEEKEKKADKVEIVAFDITINGETVKVNTGMSQKEVSDAACTIAKEKKENVLGYVRGGDGINPIIFLPAPDAKLKEPWNAGGHLVGPILRAGDALVVRTRGLGLRPPPASEVGGELSLTVMDLTGEEVTVTVNASSSLESLFNAIAQARQVSSEQICLAIASDDASGTLSNRIEPCQATCLEAGLQQGTRLYCRLQESRNLREARGKLEGMLPFSHEDCDTDLRLGLERAVATGQAEHPTLARNMWHTVTIVVAAEAGNAGTDKATVTIAVDGGAPVSHKGLSEDQLLEFRLRQKVLLFGGGRDAESRGGCVRNFQLRATTEADLVELASHQDDKLLLASGFKQIKVRSDAFVSNSPLEAVNGRYQARLQSGSSDKEEAVYYDQLGVEAPFFLCLSLFPGENPFFVWSLCSRSGDPYYTAPAAAGSKEHERVPLQGWKETGMLPPMLAKGDKAATGPFRALVVSQVPNVTLDKRLPGHSKHPGPMYVEVEVASTGASLKLAVRGETPLQVLKALLGTYPLEHPFPKHCTDPLPN